MTVPLHSCWREWPDVSPAETLNIASCFDMLLANLKPARCVLGCFDALHGLLTVQPPTYYSVSTGHARLPTSASKNRHLCFAIGT